jgi:Toxin SymE, type I toxin-antitoxin system
VAFRQLGGLFTLGKGVTMKERSLTISYSYGLNNEKPYPFIRLQGRWLERLGFSIGAKVIIATGDGILVIIPAQEGKKQEQGSPQ